MPTYEYTCRTCGEDLEAVQSFSDAPLLVCPKCGGELRKVFRSVGIVFKGSGFYKNDSRSKESATKADSRATSSAETAPAPSGTETKSSESTTPVSATPASATPATTSPSSNSTPSA